AEVLPDGEGGRGVGRADRERQGGLAGRARRGDGGTGGGVAAVVLAGVGRDQADHGGQGEHPDHGRGDDQGPAALLAPLLPLALLGQALTRASVSLRDLVAHTRETNRGGASAPPRSTIHPFGWFTAQRFRTPSASSPARERTAARPAA